MNDRLLLECAKGHFNDRFAGGCCRESRDKKENRFRRVNLTLRPEGFWPNKDPLKTPIAGKISFDKGGRS